MTRLPILAALALALPAAAQPTERSFTSPVPVGLAKGAVRPGMDYAAFRRTLLNAGWQVKTDPDCVRGVYGGDGRRKPGESNICRELPEIEACSGDGYCVANYAHPRTRRLIRVTSYGDYGQWQRKGLSVLGWEQK
jgi:hypothetical protein